MTHIGLEPERLVCSAPLLRDERVISGYGCPDPYGSCLCRKTGWLNHGDAKIQYIILKPSLAEGNLMRRNNRPGRTCRGLYACFRIRLPKAIYRTYIRRINLPSCSGWWRFRSRASCSLPRLVYNARSGGVAIQPVALDESSPSGQSPSDGDPRCYRGVQ